MGGKLDLCDVINFYRGNLRFQSEQLILDHISGVLFFKAGHIYQRDMNSGAGYSSIWGDQDNGRHLLAMAKELEIPFEDPAVIGSALPGQNPNYPNIINSDIVFPLFLESEEELMLTRDVFCSGYPKTAVLYILNKVTPENAGDLINRVRDDCYRFGPNLRYTTFDFSKRE